MTASDRDAAAQLQADLPARRAHLAIAICDALGDVLKHDQDYVDAANAIERALQDPQIFGEVCGYADERRRQTAPARKDTSP